MRRTIRLAIGEAALPVGVLRVDAEGAREHAAFEYLPEWLTAPSCFEIDPALPLVSGPQFHQRLQGRSVFPGAIADTEPDGWGRRVIMRDHAKRRQQARRSGEAVETRPLTSVDFLLAVDDASRVGALRFQDEHGIFQRHSEAGRRTAPPLIELGRLLAASRAVETNSETAADLQYLRGRGTSLDGLRPKCSVIDDDGALSIGKFPSVSDDRAVTKGEILALRLAAAAGINAAQGRLIESDGSSVALIRRFERGAETNVLMGGIGRRRTRWCVSDAPTTVAASPKTITKMSTTGAIVMASSTSRYSTIIKGA
jgi:serine/threonine-protein kinase HipA